MKHNRFKFTLVLLAAFFSISLNAKVVTQQKAMEFATRFFANNAESRSNMVSMKLAWDSNQLPLKARSSGDDSPAFFVFTPSDGEGFVIVAGDDVSVPVLGYSFENRMPSVDKLPQNLRSWLEGAHEGIVRARKKGKLASSSIEQKWVESRAGDLLVMLKTSSWGQNSPFNLQCPMDGNKYSKVGCTSVAIATIMCYYEWPKTGRGATEAYTTSTRGIRVDARNLEHQYGWDNMKMEYISGSYNDEEANAVATLMADIAIAIQADFTEESTSASAKIDVLYDHFDYHPGMYRVHRKDYEFEDWSQLMRDELMKNRPVLFRGNDAYGDSGHAFVLNGCTTDSYFHINWGWSGYCDGYFFLDALYPADDDYSYDQSAILNMIPNDGSEIANWIVAYKTGIVADTDDFHSFTPFRISACVYNINAVKEFKGAFRMAVTDREGKIKEWVCEEKSGMNLKPYYYYSDLKFSCTITGDIAIGDRIRMFYREQNTDEWKLVTSVSSSIPWEILIADEYTISESTSVSFDKESGVLIVAFKDDVAATISCNGQPVATGITYYLNSLEVETKKLLDGVYTIKLEKGLDMKEFSFEVKPL